MPKLFEISIQGHGYVLAESEDQARTVGRKFVDDIKRDISSLDLEVCEEVDGVYADWGDSLPFQDGTHPEKTCREWLEELKAQREFDARQLSLGTDEGDNHGV